MSGLVTFLVTLKCLVLVQMLLSGLNITLVILLLRKCKYFVPLKCRSPHGVSPLIMLSSLPCMALLGPCGKIWPFVASCGLCDIMRLFVALHCIAWLLYFLNWLAMQLRYSLNISTYRGIVTQRRMVRNLGWLFIILQHHFKRTSKQTLFLIDKCVFCTFESNKREKGADYIQGNFFKKFSYF